MQQMFGRLEFEGLDGELILGHPTAPDVFSKTRSGDDDGGIPKITYHVFDCYFGRYAAGTASRPQ